MSEQIIAAVVRTTREWTTSGLDHQRTQELLTKGLAANAPEVLMEWAQSLCGHQRRHFKEVKRKIGFDCYPINIGPLTRTHIRAFAAKLACALHYHEIGRILPLAGGIVVIIRSFEQFVRGWRLPMELAQKLDTLKTLRQGKVDVADQFQWASAHDETGSLYVADLGSTLGLILVVCDDIRSLDETVAQVGHVCQPGKFYSNPEQSTLLGLVKMSWTQELSGH